MKHKRLISLLTAALTGLSASSVPVIMQETASLTAHAGYGDWHEEWFNGDVKYGYYEGTNEAIITRCYGEYRTPGSDLTIPDTIAGMPVTTIASRAFNAQKFRSVTLPDTVKVIEARAFEACTLTSISLPESLESIGAYAFARSWLEDVTVPASIKVIEESTFANCDRMTSVTLKGAEQIEVNAFLNCNNIVSLTIPENCTTVGNTSAFSDCKKLEFINGYRAVTEETDENGIPYPVLDPHIYNIVNTHFSRSLGVKFVDDYCTKLCKYVVKTETSYDPDLEVQTNDWMNDALKARQLHDWLIRHCEYDHSYVQSQYDLRHYLYSSFFLSYATSPENKKMGLTVCEGYAKAYTMLLAACGIESYVIGDSSGRGHAFNMVKVPCNGVDRYYEVDTTWDDGEAEVKYEYFLKSDADMYAAHGSKYPFSYVEDLSDEHELLDVYHEYYEYLKRQCTESYPDANGDGILDYDYDLDGYDFSHDFQQDLTAYQGMLRFAFGVNSSMDQINDRLSDAFSALIGYDQDFWTYLNNSSPTNTTVHEGDYAEFSVNLFGDNLTYQWWFYNESVGSWQPLSWGRDATLRFEAGPEKSGMRFVVLVYNKEGYYIYSNPVELTVE